MGWKDIMKTKNFKKECLRTLTGLKQFPNADLLHAAMGMSTEANEFLDGLKKHMFYGAKLDIVNLKEELGDMLWYMAIAMYVLDTDFNKEMDRVINKLRTRYPEKFTEEDALDRDLDAERKELERE